MLDILTWSKFNCYTFYEKEHKYFYYNTPVKQSVTAVIEQFFEPFNTQEISKKYAEKHHLNQEEVIKAWEENGKLSSISGTIIHKYLEDYARGKVFEIDYSEAKKEGLEDKVKERVNILLPQAKKFHEDTLNKLVPIQCEYTVGIEDIIAGNIDLLCWNVKAGEFQIWDYKNVKRMNTCNAWGKKALKEMSQYDDCNFVEYSLQQNLYKQMLEKKLGIQIGKCYLVHFCYEKSDYEIYECLDLSVESNLILNRLILESKNEFNN